MAVADQIYRGLCTEQMAVNVYCVIDDVAYITFLSDWLIVTGFSAHQQQGFGHIYHAAGGSPDSGNAFLLLVLQLAIFLHQLNYAEYNCKRCPEFMAYVRSEGAFPIDKCAHTYQVAGENVCKFTDFIGFKSFVNIAYVIFGPGIADTQAKFCDGCNDPARQPPAYPGRK